MFVRYGFRLAAIGIACGLAASAASTRLMSSLLFDVTPLDPVTYAIVVGRPGRGGGRGQLRAGPPRDGGQSGGVTARGMIGGHCSAKCRVPSAKWSGQWRSCQWWLNRQIVAGSQPPSAISHRFTLPHSSRHSALGTTHSALFPSSPSLWYRRPPRSGHKPSSAKEEHRGYHHRFPAHRPIRIRAGTDAARAAAADEAGAASLDKVRDILFGGQMRDLDQRFARVEERLTRETATSRTTSASAWRRSSSTPAPKPKRWPSASKASTRRGRRRPRSCRASCRTRRPSSRGGRV